MRNSNRLFTGKPEKMRLLEYTVYSDIISAADTSEHFSYKFRIYAHEP